MAFKMNGMDFGQKIESFRDRMSDPNADMGSLGGVFKKHPLHMIGKYGSPNNLQEKGSPQKVIPIVGYGLSLLGGAALRQGVKRGGMYVAKKLAKRNVSKGGSAGVSKILDKFGKPIKSSKGINPTSKAAKRVQKVTNFLTGGKKPGKIMKLLSVGGFATMIPGVSIASKIFGGKTKPKTYDPSKDAKKKKPNVKYTKAKRKDPNLDKYIKQRKLNPKGSAGYNIAQNRINLAYGVSKRHGVKTSTDTSGRKIKTSTYIPGISRQQTTANKRRNKTVTTNQNLMTGATTRVKTKANKTKTTLRTGGMVVKKKTKGGKTIIKTRRQGSIFGTRKRIS